MDNMLKQLKQVLRQQQVWIEFQEINHEGWSNAWSRWQTQKMILATPPIRTAKSGSTEVRILTWRRDCLNSIWALKSFYHFSQVDYPLFIHDGGLKKSQFHQLQYHFPDAVLIPLDRGDNYTIKEMEKRQLNRCLLYRQKNISTRKLFDFYIMSQADFLVSIDSDIVFFQKPAELLASPINFTKNKYNKDIKYFYSMELDEMEAAFGIRPIPLINSGLSLVKRDSINFSKIEEWLEHPKLFADKWVTEQTLHALASTIYGVELLPDKYCVSTHPGLESDLVCKHYPGYSKELLYREGMQHLLKMGFIHHLNSSMGNI